MYVPQQYVPGTIVPVIVGADGPDQMLFTTLDNLIAQKRVPVMIAVSIGNGSGDAQGSQRGLEYDTMSGLYAEFVETEVLPLVEKQYKVRITKDPDARATMGCSSGGSAAMAMAWYRPDLYHRVLTYSGTYVNQQYPYNPETPGGAWEFHRTLIPKSPVKPLRIWMHVSDRDNFSQSDGMHDWVLANQNMARELAAKGYKYQFVFCAQRRALRSHSQGADAAERARVCVEGLSRQRKNFRSNRMRTQKLTHQPESSVPAILARSSPAPRGGADSASAAAACRQRPPPAAAGAREPSAAADARSEHARIRQSDGIARRRRFRRPMRSGTSSSGRLTHRLLRWRADPAVLEGTVHNFTMESTDSKIYPGIRREQGTFGTPDPNNPAKLDVTTSAPAPYTRRIAVYIPKQYVPGTIVPFIVGADGPDPLLFKALDTLIAQKRVPVMVAISISNGSGDAQGSQRGLEYDTMSGLYAQFVETEVLPLVEKQYNVRLTQRSRRESDDRLQLGGRRSDVDGVVPQRSVPSRAELLRHLRESAVALQSRNAGRSMGISPDADSQQPGEADPHLDACRRS